MDSEAFKNMEVVNSSTLDTLPLPYLVAGKKRDITNPLEDFWMNKIEAIEAQYDEHIIKLKKTLLNNRANVRRLIKRDGRIQELKESVAEKDGVIQKLAQDKTKMQDELSKLGFKAKRCQDNLVKVDDVKKGVLKSLETERNMRLGQEKELTGLRHLLKNLERDKRFLLNDIAIKTGERRRAEDTAEEMKGAKYTLLKNLQELEQQRHIQGEASTKIAADMEQFLHTNRTQVSTMVTQRKEIDLMLRTMELRRKEQEETLRQLGLTRRREGETLYDERKKKEAMEHLDRQATHWRNELELKGKDTRKSSIQVKDLRRENSELKCQLADLKQKMNKAMTSANVLDIERRRITKDLDNTRAQARSLHRIMCRNEVMKERNAVKVLKSNPNLVQLLKGTGVPLPSTQEAEKDDGQGHTRNYKRREGTQEVASYRKKIFNLEHQKNELERRIDESRRREDRLRFKISKYTVMEKQVWWTEKAMVKLEGEKNQLKDVVKRLSLSDAPKKLPLEKLVTDPSILDRLSDYHQLQKRLMKQVGKVEELKRTAVSVMNYRALQKENEEADQRLPMWKLDYWKSKHERETPPGLNSNSVDTLAGMDQQLLDQDGDVLTIATLSDRPYHKEYMAYLNKEIPRLRRSIDNLERRAAGDPEIENLPDQDTTKATNNAKENATLALEKYVLDEEDEDDGAKGDDENSEGAAKEEKTGEDVKLVDNEGNEGADDDDDELIANIYNQR